MYKHEKSVRVDFGSFFGSKKDPEVPSHSSVPQPSDAQSTSSDGPKNSTEKKPVSVPQNPFSKGIRKTKTAQEELSSDAVLLAGQDHEQRARIRMNSAKNYSKLFKGLIYADDPSEVADVSKHFSELFDNLKDTLSALSYMATKEGDVSTSVRNYLESQAAPFLAETVAMHWYEKSKGKDLPELSEMITAMADCFPKMEELHNSLTGEKRQLSMFEEDPDLSYYALTMSLGKNLAPLMAEVISVCGGSNETKEIISEFRKAISKDLTLFFVNGTDLGIHSLDQKTKLYLAQNRINSTSSLALSAFRSYVMEKNVAPTLKDVKLEIIPKTQKYIEFFELALNDSLKEVAGMLNTIKKQTPEATNNLEVSK